MRTRELLRRIVVELSRPSVLVRDGVALSNRDRDTTTEIYIQWILVLVDLGYLTSCADLRPVRRVWHDMCQLDVMVVLNQQAECLSCVINRRRNGFKAHCAKISPHLFPLIKKDFDEVMSSNVWAAKRLIQLFSYTSRLSLTDIDMSQQLEEEFLRIDGAIQPISHPLIPRMQLLARNWLGPLLKDELIPRHGPGGVAEAGRCTIREKYTLLGTDRRLQYCFGDPWWEPSIDLVREARVVFVAKSYKTQRVISMEPCTLQYFQQGVWRAIDRIIRVSPFLNRRFNVHDQERNQSLARQGSFSRNYATIDLSAASDSVGYSLVKTVFAKTWLPRYILGTRSTHTRLPSGQIVALNKFAPMGSALCFPIETLLFGLICTATLQEQRLPLDLSVYGDDIIVPTASSEAVIENLSQFGFMVNHQKSYWDASHWYRESCGAEYCDGFDVTPMRVSRKFSSKDDNEKFHKWISAANTAREHALPLVRRYYIDLLERARIVPYFAPTSLQSSSYTNYHAKKRWNSSLQRFEVKTHESGSRPNRCIKNEEDLRLRYWLEVAATRENLEEPLVSNIDGTALSLRQRWMPDLSNQVDYLVAREGIPDDL